MNTGDRIQYLRKAKGISQEELADRIGVSRQAVSKWESEQSLPDIDNIIIMSDFFEVTTDYILKGIESEAQAAQKPLSANVFVYSSATFIFIGFIIACAVWLDRQVSTATVIGLIIMAFGCMTFGVGHIFSTQHKENAIRLFWKINIWLITLLPLSAIYSFIFSGVFAPYPLFYGFQYNGYSYGPILFSLFWLIYFGICAAVLIRFRNNAKK